MYFSKKIDRLNYLSNDSKNYYIFYYKKINLYLLYKQI